MVEAAAALSYRLVHRSVRPPRAVTLMCSEGDWRSDVLRMVECYSRTWGGDGNGLVACTPAGEVAEPFWRLAAALDADHWAVFGRTGRGLQMADPEAYEARLASLVEEWARENAADEAQARELIEPQFLSSSGARLMVPEVLGNLIRGRMAPLASPQVAVTAEYRADEGPSERLVDMCELTYQPARITSFDVAEFPAAVALLVAARTGLVAPGHLARLRDRGAVENVSVPVVQDRLAKILRFAWTGQADTVVEYAEPSFLEDTPLAHSRLGCAWFTAFNPGLDSEPVVVICGDSADDFCYAYTRRRVVGETYWLPASPDIEEIREDLYTTLAQILYDRTVRRAFSRPVLLSSLTLDAEQLQDVRERLLATPWGTMFSSDALRHVHVSVCAPADLPVQRNIHLLDKVHFGDTIHEPFLGTDQARNLEIPSPCEAIGVNPGSCRWQVDVLDPANVLPARWALRAIISVDDSSTHAMRSSTAGISIDSHGRMFSFAGSSLAHRLVQARLRFPAADEVFSTLLSRAGLTLEESDKGRYTRRMTELWGDFTALATDLKAGPAARLLSSWISKAGQGRSYQERKYLTLADVTNMMGETENEARQLLDRYQQRSIVTRGLLLTCGRCASTSFYRLEDIGPGFRCQRCRQQNEIARSAWKGQELEPQWYYGLDEVAYQGLRSNVHVPVLALASLANSAMSFQHMSERIVHRPGQEDIEVDLWAIVDGRIVIGEAKVNDRLERTKRNEVARCAALRHLAEDLSADEFVMATAGSGWHERTKSIVEEKIVPVTAVRWLSDLR